MAFKLDVDPHVIVPEMLVFEMTAFGLGRYFIVSEFFPFEIYSLRTGPICNVCPKHMNKQKRHLRKRIRRIKPSLWHRSS